MKLIHLFLAINSFLGFSTIENPCNIMYPRSSTNWGVGVMWLPWDSEITLFDNEGKVFGKLRRNFSSWSNFEVLDLNNLELSTFKENFDFDWVGGYDLSLIKVFEKSNDKYFKVFGNSEKNGLWISKNEAEDKGVKFLTYESILFNHEIPEEIRKFRESANIGVNIEKSCLNLRTTPSDRGNKISCIPGNDWDFKKLTHFEILKQNGKWAFVEVTFSEWREIEKEGENDCSYFEIKKEKGWVKAIDDNNFPNIWFSVTAY